MLDQRSSILLVSAYDQAGISTTILYIAHLASCSRSISSLPFPFNPETDSHGIPDLSGPDNPKTPSPCMLLGPVYIYIPGRHQDIMRKRERIKGKKKKERKKDNGNEVPTAPSPKNCQEHPIPSHLPSHPSTPLPSILSSVVQKSAISLCSSLSPLYTTHFKFASRQPLDGCA
ncbi:hypothetical protein VTK26DRAFT_2714 [Humicola hyalothermophila]